MGKSYIIKSNNPEFINNKINEMLTELKISKSQKTTDYYEINTIEGKSTISIDQMKNLKSWSNTKPFNSSSKLAVIFEADKLTEQAQNSILKLLEEPNKYSTFILISSNLNKLLKTIISRCELILDKNLPSNDYNIARFISSDLLNRIEYIKQICSIKDIRNRNNIIDEFLLSLARFYRNRLKSGIDVSNEIRSINDCKKYISANVSVKNSLTNLCLELDKS